MPGPIFFHKFLHLGEQVVTVFAFVHIDKIDDDNTSHIAQTQLAGNFFGGRDIHHIGAVFLSERRFVPITAIDIDHVQSFGVFDDQIRSVLKGNRFSKERFYLFGYPEIIQNRQCTVIGFYDIFFVGCDNAYVFGYFFGYVFIVNVYLLKRRVKDIAQQGYRTPGFLENERRGFGFL